MEPRFKQHTPKPSTVAPLGSRRAKAKSAKVENPKPGDAATPAAAATERPREIGGPSGPEPTRYGDWEVKGRCVDF